MPFFAALKRSKIAREQSADRDGGEPSSKRSKRGVLRELFRRSTWARQPEEKQSDIEVVCHSSGNPGPIARDRCC